MQPTESSKIKYLECDKSGFHFGEVLNMVCVQQSCLQDLVCCCACIEQNHKKHTTKPLKMIIREAKDYSDKLKPAKIDLDVVINIVNKNKKETFDEYEKYKESILSNLNNIEKSLSSYYSYISQQVKLKSCDPKEELNKILKIVYEDNSKTVQAFRKSIIKLVSLIPNKEEEISDLTEEDIVDSIKNSNEEIWSLVEKNINNITQKLSQCNQSLTLQINSKNLWASYSKYKFSNNLKHHDVKLMSQFIVKSQNTSGYKFAIMEPNLEKGSKVKKFAFKIKQTTSNWIAVGMCHSKIVANKNYVFNFSTLGHGGYLVSSNGGSWSNTKAQANNTVKAFKFTKGDIIRCIANFETKKILFKKKNQTYELNFSTINGDQLFPCALFYYVNDEIEFLPKHKQF